MSPEPIAADLPGRSWRGGARLDLQNATYPFANLTVLRDQLELEVTALVYRFRPDQVRGIEVVRAVPLLGKGIRIHHDIAGYPQLIIFWTMGNPATLARHLRQYGYGTDPLAEFEPTKLPADRTVFFLMFIAIVVFFLIPLLFRFFSR